MQRRKFVNNCFWISTGLLVGCSKTVEGKSITYQLLKGVVTSGGTGVAGVVVSDGFSVIKTAADGSYEINVPSISSHVFVSVPSGYAFPHQKNLAQHYISIDGTAVQKLNFELEPLTVDDEKHQFIIWADPQMQDDGDLKRFMTRSLPDLQNYTKTVSPETLIHGIMVGDIVFDNFSLFSGYNNAVEKSGLPFFQMIGNHDIDYNRGKENYNAQFKEIYGPTYYSFNRGQVHYVVLDDVTYVGGEAKYYGHIPNEQLLWLQKDLAMISNDKLIVICLHIQTLWVDNREDLYKILRNYKVHIMSGHAHANQNYINGNIFEHVHGSVCGAWWTASICHDGTPAGYGIYEVDGTDLKWHYKSVDYKKDYQIRTSVSQTNGQKKLQANVWNWDPEWKIEWWMDDNFQGVMPKADGLDDLSIKLFTGPDLPLYKSWVEPHFTDHLFAVLIPEGTTQVKVQATDRFGKTYEAVTKV